MCALDQIGYILIFWNFLKRRIDFCNYTVRNERLSIYGWLQIHIIVIRTVQTFHCSIYSFAEVIITQAIEKEREEFSSSENKFSYYVAPCSTNLLPENHLNLSNGSIAWCIQPVNGKHDAQTRTYSAIVHGYLDHIYWWNVKGCIA